MDTNVLVHAHREDSPWHREAARRVTELAGSGERWGIPWPCVHEFLAVVTHPRVFKPPTAMADALRAIDSLLEAPTLVLLHEDAGYWLVLCELLEESRVKGPKVHDARIAAICLSHGVEQLWSADRDYSRFPRLPVRNPLIG